MPPAALPNLYCTPNDLFDYLGLEGVELGLDDHLRSTGYTICVTATAMLGATSLAVAAIQSPLLAGQVLTFDGAGMPSPPGEVQVTLATTAKLGATSLNTLPLTAQVNLQATATDSGVNLVQAQRLLKASEIGTSRVKLYLCSKYDDSVLATSWDANRWATYLGSKWFCTRRSKPCPQSVADAAEEAVEEMKQVRVGMLALGDVGTRTSGWPFIDNFRIDVGYDLMRIRVEQTLSEGTTTQFGQYPDWNSIFLLEF